MLRAVLREDLAVHMSFWLASRCPPSAFRQGITTLVPKSAEAKQPGEYRQIAVASIVARLFHRVLALRCEEIPLSQMQKAFRRGDGLGHNVWTLRSILHERTQRRKPICVTFIDVAKAFDSVSHDSMVAAVRRVGMPETVLEYLSSLYQGSTTRLKVGQSLSGEIVVGRGVRQGGPLSPPPMFHYVMDWVLSDLDPQLGVQLEDNLRLNHLPFADDVALVTESPRGA